MVGTALSAYCRHGGIAYQIGMILIITEPGIFCPRPFEWCEIHPDGSVFLCCPAWLKRPIGNLLLEPARAIWNGGRAIELRKSILNRSYHNCNRKRCPFLTDPATAAVDQAGTQAAAAIAGGESRLDYPPQKLNLCFDHSCNLACPSCRNETRNSRGSERDSATRIAEPILDQLLPGATQLTLSGYGDPFGSPVYFNLLKRIDTRSAPQLRELRLHSNGLLFDEAHWRQLPALHPLLRAVEISVDAGSAATYAENRGGDFLRLLHNLAFIAGLGVPLRLSMVIQQNNFAEIPQLFAIARSLGASLYLSRLVNWGTFSREEFRRRDVGDLTHPQHTRLREILAEMAGREGFDPGNLAQPDVLQPGL